MDCDQLQDYSSVDSESDPPLGLELCGFRPTLGLELCGSKPTPGLELFGFRPNSRIRALWIWTQLQNLSPVDSDPAPEFELCRFRPAPDLELCGDGSTSGLEFFGFRPTPEIELYGDGSTSGLELCGFKPTLGTIIHLLGTEREPGSHPSTGSGRNIKECTNKPIFLFLSKKKYDLYLNHV